MSFDFIASGIDPATVDLTSNSGTSSGDVTATRTGTSSGDVTVTRTVVTRTGKFMFFNRNNIKNWLFKYKFETLLILLKRISIHVTL